MSKNPGKPGFIPHKNGFTIYNFYLKKGRLPRNSLPQKKNVAASNAERPASLIPDP